MVTITSDTFNPSILIFYFCTTNNHNPSSLKPHSLIVSQSGMSEVWHCVASSPAQGLLQAEITVSGKAATSFQAHWLLAEFLSLQL